MKKHMSAHFKAHMITFMEYLGHLVIGALMFLALLAVGGALNKIVHWAGPVIGDPHFVWVVTWVEKVILYGDVLFILWWVIYSTYQAVSKLHRPADRSESHDP